MLGGLDGPNQTGMLDQPAEPTTENAKIPTGEGRRGQRTVMKQMHMEYEVYYMPDRRAGRWLDSSTPSLLQQSHRDGQAATDPGWGKPHKEG